MRNFLPELRELIEKGEVDAAVEVHRRATGSTENRSRDYVDAMVRTGYPPRPGLDADAMVDAFAESTRLMADGDDDAAIDRYVELAEVDAERARTELLERLSDPGAPRMSDEVLHRQILQMYHREDGLDAAVRRTKLYQHQRDCTFREASRVVDSLEATGYPPRDGYTARQMQRGFERIEQLYLAGDVQSAINGFCELTGESPETAREKLERASEEHEQFLENLRWKDASDKGW